MARSAAFYLSSLGVYEGRDHHGTDETVEPSTTGMDGYTLTKVESEQLVLRHIREKKLPATVIRPGFIYGPRDRTVLPRLLERLKSGQVKYFGTGEQLMNNTFVVNLVDAIFEALDRPEAIGEVYNVTDGKLVSKRDFISTVATEAGYGVPQAAVPLGVAKVLTRVSEKVYRFLGKKEAPLLSNARFKFLGLNLDFSIEKARRQLGYQPRFTFQEGMKQTIDWFREQKLL
jgi:nucleoside-diphosphate-sugar epimerase